MRLSKADLARITKISPPQVGRYVSGETQPKIEVAISIAKAFNVNLDDLILKDLSKEEGRPFGAEGEDRLTMEETLLRMNKLLEQRLKILEAEIKKENPQRAKDLGIE